jgi:SulP family sulfate permease
MKPATAGMGVKLVPMLIVVAGIGVTIALSLDLNHGVRVVGPLPQALPALVLPTLSLTSLEQLALPAGALALIGFISSVSVAQTLAQREQEQINPNREMLGLGASNVVAALAGGLPVTGGLSRSVVNYTAGARSPLSGVVSASLLVLILIQFSMGPYFARLPVCVLAASIIAPMLNVLEPRSFLRIWRYAHADGLSFLATALGVLIFGVEIGIALGIGLSLLTIIWQASHPHIALLGRVAGSEQFRNVERAAVELNPRILALRIDENLFFGNIGVVEAALATALEDQPDAQHVLLVLSSVNHIDATALERLLALNESLMTRHKLLHLAEVKGPVLDQLQRSRLPQILSGQVFRFTHEAFAALEAN